MEKETSIVIASTPVMHKKNTGQLSYPNTELTLTSMHPGYKTSVEQKMWQALYEREKECSKTIKLTFQGKVYNFLERPKSWRSYLYHIFVALGVLACVLFSMFNTVKEYYDLTYKPLYFMELGLVTFFAAEYLIRIWSVGCRVKYQGFYGRVKYMTRALSILDLLVVMIPGAMLCVDARVPLLSTSPIRCIRLFQVTRILHANRQAGSTWKLLSSVVASHKQELLTAIYFGLLGIFVSSNLMYMAEGEVLSPDLRNSTANFPDYFEALWWSLITMTTIGYGDRVPQTTLGKVIGAVSALFTVSFFALPAGILGSGFALKVQQQQKQKRFTRQVPAAAMLIKRAFQYYVLYHNFNQDTVWVKFLNVPDNRYSINNMKSRKLGLLKRRLHSKVENSNNLYPNDGHLKPSRSETALNAEGKQSTNSSRCASPVRPPSLSSPHSLRILFEPCRSPKLKASISAETVNTLDTSLDIDEDTQSINNSSFNRDTIDKDMIGDPVLYSKMTKPLKIVILAIKKMQFLVVKRKFQRARKPYDVPDVIEQYTEGQIDIKARIKDLQRRMDQALGKPGLHLAHHGEKPQTIFAKLQTFEKQINTLENKMDRIIFLLEQPQPAIAQ